MTKKKPKAEKVRKKGIPLTARQEKVVQILASGTTKNKGEILKEAGYAPSTYQHPKKVFSTEGVQMALKELGINPMSIMRTLTEAQKANIVTTYRGETTETDVPDHKLRAKVAVDMAEITGMKKLHIKQENINVNLDISEAKDLFG